MRMRVSTCIHTSLPFHIHTHLSPYLYVYMFLPFCNPCVCVCQLVYTLPSPFIFIHIYRHIYMYICFDYSVITPCILYTPIRMRLCVPASWRLVLMLTQLWLHVQACTFQYSSVSLLPINTHIPCAYQKCSILCAPTPSLGAFFNHVFLRIQVYSIHLKMCSHKNVYTKTVQCT